ncbi:MAG: YtxH domain-containing protein [Rhizobacter sp.]|nr:YtxH domain-containing protein [Ferruginibacter sp.]
MKNGKFLAGVIAGLGTGVLLGLLFAPAKGSQTRKRIMKGSRYNVAEAKVSLHDVMRKNKEKLQHQLDQNDLNSSVM